MAVNASDRTLGLINIWQVLRKLYWELRLIDEISPTVVLGAEPEGPLHAQDAIIYAAINASSTALALVDWLYHTVRDDQTLCVSLMEFMGSLDIGSDKSFLASFRKLNSSINACHQICNANKHFYLRRPDPNFKAMVFEIVSQGPDGTTKVTSIAQIMRNGNDPSTVMSVAEMLKGLAEWWEALLSAIGVPGREEFFYPKCDSVL